MFSSVDQLKRERRGLASGGEGGSNPVPPQKVLVKLGLCQRWFKTLFLQLEKLINNYESLGSIGREAWERMQASGGSLQSISQKLTGYTTLLEPITGGFKRGLSADLFLLLNKLVEELTGAEIDNDVPESDDNDSDEGRELQDDDSKELFSEHDSSKENDYRAWEEHWATWGAIAGLSPTRDHYWKRVWDKRPYPYSGGHAKDPTLSGFVARFLQELPTEPDWKPLSRSGKSKRRLRPEDYTVGWVSTLPVELAAAAELLDEEHEDIPQDPNDTNLYTLGRIGEHNIVIACLPAGQTGTTSAAEVAVQMKAKFISIRFGLMVGIGGGVPSDKSDIRLGDVVVSQPYMKHGGVVQYDFGKTTSSGFVRTSYLNTPPTILLNALVKLQANNTRRRSVLMEYLSALSCVPEFARDNAGPDILFESTYNHVGGPTCEKCSIDRLLERTKRGSQEIIVHYGTIASGNQVIRDGVTRDRLSSELGGVLCFEMEAAGLMNSFPCLVIRGICDYADSHKNKRWQPYAAATAAAYAREVLSVIPAGK